MGPTFAARKYRDPWTPVLAQSPAEKGVLYMGTQYVLRTSDGGLHWTQISPDLTGAAANPGAHASLPASRHFRTPKQRGYGVVFSIAPSPLDAGLIWAGSDTGLLHLTRDGGKNWQNVTPPGLSDWSKITMIEASHFDPAVAYVAVDRHRLDDYTPHLFRTRDYGKTWQAHHQRHRCGRLSQCHPPGPAEAEPALCRDRARRLRFLRRRRSLAAAATKPAGNLGARSARSTATTWSIATHGRGFWILDDITPLRQISEQTRNAAGGPLRSSKRRSR